MRYKITLSEDVHKYGGIIYQNFDEPNIQKDHLSITQRKLFSLSNAYNKLYEEMRSQSAFSIVSIEEAPEEISSVILDESLPAGITP
jgi:hypothetical protein